MLLSKRDAKLLAEMPMNYSPTSFPVRVAGVAGEVAAWVLAPPPQALSAEPVVLDMYPDWIHDKHYWHFVPSHRDGSYSFAQYMVEHYWTVVVACDYLGTGESSKPANGFALTFEALAEARAQVAEQIRSRMLLGTLAPDLPRQPKVHLIGIGQGTGALTLQQVQARFQQPYEAIALLGWTCGEPRFGPVDQGKLAEVLHPDTHGYVALSATQRQAMRPCFYLDDVAQEIIEVDEQHGTVLPFGLVNTPLNPSSILADAAAIMSPVFLGYGSHDIACHPSEEDEFYSKAISATAYIQPNAACCHNLAPTRHLLWKAIGWWLQDVLRQPPAHAPQKGSRDVC